MAKNRKKTEEYILKWIAKVTNNDEFNINLYKDLFKSMSDKEFDAFMEKLNKGNILNIIVPHEKIKLYSKDRNLKLAKEIGTDLFKYIIFGAHDDMPAVKSKYKYLVYILPFRRMKQTVEKGISISEDDKHIDLRTGQVTGPSRASKLSYPELQVLIGMGMRDSVVELLRDRGGDPGAMRVIKQALAKYGKVSNSLIEMYKEGVVSSQTLKSYFNGMHYKINISE